MWSDFPTYHQVKSPPRCTSFTSGELSYSNQAFPTRENLWRLAMWLASNGEKSNSAESTVIFYLWSCNPHSNLAFTLSIAPINLMYPHLPLFCSSLPELRCHADPRPVSHQVSQNPTKSNEFVLNLTALIREFRRERNREVWSGVWQAMYKMVVSPGAVVIAVIRLLIPF